ncbi:MFS transporter, DHA2 family, metal-tetracycline-proton antiporter [Seinonella peptonophila]|uniref:MFS transporter, DHA2 family, metal-tetracycline-proton antiporter n=1 Tax=Seinonella peptonophila TaxID=112248 RepID=A0A1M4U2C9_9BACL|nr:MFS transporter [Seinonella peptonophila]SHE50756.1 MFS transporter, DHA2 family, metal-tetracycline-proton antiporter [Seinonella peptonophila]
MSQKMLQPTGEKLMYVVMFTHIISAMTAFMFNFVLPEIRQTFHLTTVQVSWVTSSYILIYGMGTVLYGKLADQYKLKNLLTFGLLFFAFGSIVGLISQTYSMVLVGRCLQAVGAAVIPATSNIIPIRYFSPEKRGAAIGMAFVGLSIGGAIGPILSAFIISITNWHWLFLSPCFVLCALPFYQKYLREEERSFTKQMDWLGCIFLAIAVTTLLLSITKSSWILSLVGGCSIGLFVIRIYTITNPFIQPRLFASRGYSIGLILAFILSGILLSLPFLTPLLLSQVYRLQPQDIAFMMVPAAIVSAILGRTGGRIADRKGNLYLFVISSLLLIISFVLLNMFLKFSPWFISIFLVLGTIGQTFIMIAISNSISTILPRGQAGIGMGILSMVIFIAQAVASVSYGKLIDLGGKMGIHEGFIYSNIFLILTIAQVLILFGYYFLFYHCSKKSLLH